MKKILLKSQKNDVFEAVKNVKLNHDEFQWTEAKGSSAVVSVLIHSPSSYYFKFDIDDDDEFYPEFSPGKQKPREMVFTSSWDKTLYEVLEWANALKIEIESLDLWETILREKQFIETASADTSNEKFGSEEKKYICTQLVEIKRYLIETLNLSKDHIDIANKRLDYLKGATERLGRKDWLNNAVGVFFSLVIGLALNPEKARDFLRFVSTCLSKLFTTVLQIQ